MRIRVTQKHYIGKEKFTIIKDFISKDEYLFIEVHSIENEQKQALVDKLLKYGFLFED